MAWSCPEASMTVLLCPACVLCWRVQEYSADVIHMAMIAFLGHGPQRLILCT